MKLHICNTQFEWELVHPGINLENSFASHPVHLQLQFLPFLYGDREDQVFITDGPENDFFKANMPKPYRDPAAITEVESWGPSLAIKKWTERHHLKYDIPDMGIVKTIASKTFPFEQGISLPGAACIKTEKDLQNWLKEINGPFVLKLPFSTAGRGNKIFKCKTALHYGEILPILSKNGVLLAEPWITRSNDFSSQWNIEKNGTIACLGWTEMICSDRGSYLQTLISDETPPFFDEHIEIVKPLLEKIAEMGFFGQLGLDAFVYDNLLHPVCEINPRKTMGWLALQFKEKLGLPNLKMHYGQGDSGLLPHHLENHKPFSLQLTVSYP